jgi:hypothetical protein
MGWSRRTYLNYAGSGFWTGAAALRNRSPTVTIPVDYRAQTGHRTSAADHDPK